MKSSILKHAYTYIQDTPIFWQEIGVKQLDTYNVQRSQQITKTITTNQH